MSVWKFSKSMVICIFLLGIVTQSKEVHAFKEPGNWVEIETPTNPTEPYVNGEDGEIGFDVFFLFADNFGKEETAN